MTKNRSFQSRLEDAAEQLALSLSVGQIEKLLLYLEQLQRWNRIYNLTAIRDPEQMLIQHIFDSLAVIPVVDRLLDKKPANQCTIVDVGSGAGLPGIVLAIANQWTVHCVDSVEKKMTFVRQMAGKLDLPNLNAHHARIENMEPFDADVVISRAFSSLSDFTRLAGRHSAESGCLLAMKGRQPDEEIDALEDGRDWTVKSMEPLSVPELDAHRCVLHLYRQGKL